MTSGDSELSDVVAEARQELRASIEAIARGKRAAQETWEMLAGPFGRDMLNSPEAAASLLANPDAKVRMAALLVIREHWKPMHFQRICQKLADSDGDEQVRNLAVISFGRFYKETNDPDVGTTLARMVLDESRTAKMRTYAYTGLFQLRGVPVDSWPAAQDHFTFPEDVDWVFVNSFLGQGDNAGGAAG